MKTVSNIPKQLIYETFEGHAIYRKGYRAFISGLEKLEAIPMGTSALQWFIINVIYRKLLMDLPGTFTIGAGELGLHLSSNTNFAADIAVYRPGQFQVGFQATKYAESPPSLVVEVDIKIDESGYFQNDEDYFQRKTEKLLQWGVERVIWVFPVSRRILIADNLQKWELCSWELPVTLLDSCSIPLWDELLKNGFENT